MTTSATVRSLSLPDYTANTVIQLSHLGKHGFDAPSDSGPRGWEAGCNGAWRPAKYVSRQCLRLVTAVGTLIRRYLESRELSLVEEWQRALLSPFERLRIAAQVVEIYGLHDLSRLRKKS